MNMLSFINRKLKKIFIGKTETTNLIAKGLFKQSTRLKYSDTYVPSGLLVFRGEDFNDNFTNPITEYHAQIKNR